MSKVDSGYRQLREELDEVLARMQDGQIDIDEAIQLYEKGGKIVAELKNYLENAENKISKIRDFGEK